MTCRKIFNRKSTDGWIGWMDGVDIVKITVQYPVLSVP